MISATVTVAGTLGWAECSMTTSTVSLTGLAYATGGSSFQFRILATLKGTSSAMSSATTFDAQNKAIDYAANLVSISRTSTDTKIDENNTHFIVGSKNVDSHTGDKTAAGVVDKTGGTNTADFYAIKIAQTLPALSNHTSGVTISFPWTNTAVADYQYYFDSSSANREVYASDLTSTTTSPETACTGGVSMTHADWSTGSGITATPSSSTSVLGTVAFDPTTASWSSDAGTTAVGFGVCFQLSASSGSNSFVANPKVMSNYSTKYEVWVQWTNLGSSFDASYVTIL